MKKNSGVCVFFSLFLLQVAALLFTCGCSDSDHGEGPEVDLVLEVISGDNQTGQASRSLAEQVTVAVRAAGGEAAPGVSVRFEVTAGGGSLFRASEVTDDAGQASVSWTLGSPPVWNRMKAEAGGSVGYARAWAEPGVPPPLELVCQAPADSASEDLAFWPGRGLFLGSPGAILQLAAPGAGLVELALTGQQISNPVGIAFGAAGDLYACENDTVSGTAVKQITPSGVCSTLSSGFQRTPFSLPNSIALHGSGDLYLSVTCDGRIYRISSQDGSTSVFLSVSGPNGLAFNADDSYLYFTTEHAGLFCGQPGPPGGLYRVAVSPEGEADPIEPEPLVEGFALAGDGLVFDGEGNLYVVFTVLGDGGLGALLTSAVFVYTEDGRFNRYFSVSLLGDILTNIEFGVAPFDPSSLYTYGFTGRVYRVETGIPGLALP